MSTSICFCNLRCVFPAEIVTEKLSANIFVKYSWKRLHWYLIINKVSCQVFSFKLPTNFSYELSRKPFQWKPMINSFCFVVNKLNKRSQTTRTFFQWLMQSLLLCGYKSFNIIALLLKEGGQWIFIFEFKRSFTPKTIISCIAILITGDH